MIHFINPSLYLLIPAPDGNFDRFNYKEFHISASEVNQGLPRSTIMRRWGQLLQTNNCCRHWQPVVSESPEAIDVDRIYFPNDEELNDPMKIIAQQWPPSSPASPAPHTPPTAVAAPHTPTAVVEIEDSLPPDEDSQAPATLAIEGSLPPDEDSQWCQAAACSATEIEDSLPPQDNQVQALEIEDIIPGPRQPQAASDSSTTSMTTSRAASSTSDSSTTTVSTIVPTPTSSMTASSILKRARTEGYFV